MYKNFVFKGYDSLWAIQTFVRKILHANLPIGIGAERSRHKGDPSPPVPPSVSTGIPSLLLNAIMACTGTTLPLAMQQFLPEKCIIKTYDHAYSIIMENDTRKYIRHWGSKSARSVGTPVSF